MKTRLAILVALAAAGVSSGAYATGYLGDVPVPGTSLAGTNPGLFASEQGAFKGLEAATQLVESRIVQNGCTRASFDLSVSTDSSGTGSVVLGNDWQPNRNFVTLGVRGFPLKANYGRQFSIYSSGGYLDGLRVGTVSGSGSFNATTALQQLSTNWSIKSPVTGTMDPFYGTIIKDYKRLNGFAPIPRYFDDAYTPVSTVIDYGYQQVSKLGYINSKYWQQSRTWRENGVNSGVLWVKTRVVPSSCYIVVNLQGYGAEPSDGPDGFNEMGFISVSPTPPAI